MGNWQNDRPVGDEKPKKFHVVNTDNFGGDYPDESFVAKEIAHKKTAQVIADALNAWVGDGASRFYKVVEDGYELQPGFEP